MKEKLEKEIKEVLQEWHDQDNASTRWPYYVTIRDCRERYEESIHGDYIYDEEAEQVISIEDKLKELIDEDRLNKEDYEVLDIEGPQDKDSLDINFFNKSDYLEVLKEFGIDDRRTFDKVEEWYEEGVFFTIKDAQEYLDSCMNHHTNNAHTYITTFTKWGRTSQTELFLENLFNYFEINLPRK